MTRNDFMRLALQSENHRTELPPDNQAARILVAITALCEAGSWQCQGKLAERDAKLIQAQQAIQKFRPKEVRD